MGRPGDGRDPGGPGGSGLDSPVVVGALYLRLHLPEARSLKDKRQVIRSLMERLRNRYGVSVAEVGDQETWQVASLGVTTVSRDGAVCLGLLDEIVRWVEGAGSYAVLEAHRELR